MGGREQVRENGCHDSRPYSTASRHASFNRASRPCSCKPCRVVKEVSHAGQECALNLRCVHADRTRFGESLIRDRFEQREL